MNEPNRKFEVETHGKDGDRTRERERKKETETANNVKTEDLQDCGQK